MPLGKEDESHMAFFQTIISSSNFFLLFASPVHRLTSGSQATKATIAASRAKAPSIPTQVQMGGVNDSLNR